MNPKVQRNRTFLLNMQASEALLISSDEEIENRPPTLPGSDINTVNKVKRPRKQATTSSSTNKQKIDGQTIKQHRRKYDDLVKSRINCEKYTISATTFVKVQWLSRCFDKKSIMNDMLYLSVYFMAFLIQILKHNMKPLHLQNL